MTKKLYIRDTNGTGTWYDASNYVFAWPLDLELQASGKVGTLTGLKMKSHKAGVAFGIVPLNGMEVMYYEHDAHGPGQHVYRFAGDLNVRDRDLIPEGVMYTLAFSGPEQRWRTHIPHMQFDQVTYPNDSSRITRAFALASQYGLRGVWDATSQVATGGFVSYPAGSLSGYHRQTLQDILDQTRGDVGQSTDPNYPVPVREMYVHGEWADPGNIPNSGILWVVHYYSPLSVQQEIVPLTDRPDRMADYVSDSFTRTANATSLGTSDTGQVWATLQGTFGISAAPTNVAYVPGSVTQQIAVVNAGIADGEVKVGFSQNASLQRVAFRVTSEPSNPWKWEGYIVQNEGGAGYSLFNYLGGTFTQLGGTYSCTPANGDILKVVLAGSSIKVYLNGGSTPILTGTGTFNNTATLYGIAQQGGSIAQWDNFSVRGVAALHSGLTQKVDTSNTINIQAIAGPGSDPVAVNWANQVGVTGAQDGSLTKTLKPSAWQASHAYSTGDRVQPTKPNGRHYKVTSVGSTSSATEPATWNLTEGGTTTDGALTWTTEMWDAGAVSQQVITEDGGWVSAQVEQTWKVSDYFERPDDNAQLGSAGSGQAWAVAGTDAVWGIESGRAKAISGTGPIVAVVESGVSTTIVQAVLPVAVNGARLGFRYSDIYHFWFVQAETTVWRVYKREPTARSAWAASTAYAVNAYVRALTFNGRQYKCTTAGTSGATQPSWNTTVGGTTTDGTVVWTCEDAAITETSMGVYAATPANGDVVKVVLSDSTIQLYTNGVYRLVVTDNYNEGATIHGLGVATAGGTARFDNFDVWQTYTMDAFGLTATGTGITSWAQLGWGWLKKADRTIRVCEGGVEIGSTALSYANGDNFKIEVKPTQIGTTVVPVVKYYRWLTTDTDWIEVYTSLVTPTMTTASPLYAGGAIYHAGATIANVTMRRFTYGLYQDDASVALYGPKPASDVLTDDMLDTEAKRKARAQGIFARHPAIETVELDTLQEYVQGRAVLISSTKMVWTNRRMLIPNIKPGWDHRRGAPKFHVTLNMRRREFSEKEPLGYLTGGAPDSQEGPATPTGLTAGVGTPDGPTTVQQPFTWTQTTGGEQYIWLQVQRVGQEWEAPVRFSAERNTNVLHGLIPLRPYNARIRAQDYSGRYSAQWSRVVQFQSAGIPVPLAPTGLLESSNTFDEALGRAVVVLHWTPSTTNSGRITQRLYVTVNQTSLPIVQIPDNVTNSYTLTMQGGAPYYAFVTAVNELNGESPSSNLVTGTAVDQTVFDRLQNPDFEIPDPFLFNKPWRWVLTPNNGTVQWITSEHASGTHSIRMTFPSGTTSPTITSPFFRVSEVDLFWLEVALKASVSDFNGFSVAMTFYDASFAGLSTYSGAIGNITTSWVSKATTGGMGGVTGARYAKLQIGVSGAARVGNFFIDNLRLSSTLPTISLDDLAVTGAKLETLSPDPSGTVYFPTLTVDSKGRVTAATTGTATAPIKIVSGVISHITSGVSAGTYTNATVVVDTYGHITSATSGTAPVTGVTGTAPIVSSGGATPAISIIAASAVAAGSMSSADYSKLARLTLATAATISGGGTLSLGGFTLTVPATGTVALLGTANQFTADQTTTGQLISTGALAGFNMYDRTGYASGELWSFYSNRSGGAGTQMLRFWSGGADRVTISAGGNLNITGGLTTGSDISATGQLISNGSLAGFNMYDRTGYGASELWAFYSDRTGGAGTQTLRFWTGGSDRVTITPGGVLNVTGSYQVGGTQVLTSRRTGWAAATGTASRATFATSTVTLATLAGVVKALVDDLMTHGVIGT